MNITRKKSKKRITNHLCPNCMSTLTTKNGKYECTGDVINYWKTEISKYNNLTNSEKNIYLENLEDKSIFLNMIENKNLKCSYSSDITPIVSDNNVLVPDPLVVSKIELKLSRKLTEEELVEGKTFYKKNNDFSLTKKPGYNKFEIPFLRFPEDFL